MNDLTIIYLTANEIPDQFGTQMRVQLSLSAKDIEVITVSKKPLPFGEKQIVTEGNRSHIGIYRDALLGAQNATTKYIAIVEDDVLYSPEHFKKRPTEDDVFAYNVACWSIYTWSKPPIFSYSGRRNFGQLICNRELFIEAMEERFKKYLDGSKVNLSVWAEPGKYESQLGVTARKSQGFYTDPANIMFSHQKGLSFLGLGERKRLAPIRALEIPHWGTAERIVSLYA